jgi:xanthine/CO dehydrogenase XdhC/CoxF family maturation factor
MKEIKAIIKAYDAIDRESTKAALATVVRVEGSSYRRTGARMLVMDDGGWVGGISGGCLEGDALKRARLAITRSVSTLITYDTSGDDPYQIGIGLGCNGIIDVLFTPLDYEDRNNPVEILRSCIEASRQTHVLVTVTRLEGEGPGLRAGQVLMYTGKDGLAPVHDATIESALTEAITRQLDKGRSAPHQLVTEQGKVFDCFIEILPPEISIVLAGHQYDVYPFSRLFKELDWRVTIVANPHKLNSRITAMVDQVLPPDDFQGLLIDAYTVIVLMSHDYKTDKKFLPKALATASPYIGILGPRSRSERMLDELSEEGLVISSSEALRIHAPIGLDIGAVTPEEIALSLAAEVKAALASREGGFLRLRPTSINDRD